jgi:hypothetical protein
MQKYRVIIEDWTSYAYEVEAESKQEAADKAMALWEHNEKDFDDSRVIPTAVEPL